jgi:hypothetical protein
MRGPIVRRIAFLLAAATVLAFPTGGTLADTGPCHSMEYERAAYTICEVDLRSIAVDVLTPPAILAVLSAGYEPRWHLSAKD